MGNLVKFSEASSLAIHAAVLLAASRQPMVASGEMARQLSVSEAHLAKVLARLTRAGLVKASRGPSGGYRLAGDPAQLDLLTLYEAIEGRFEIRHCLFDRPVCCGLSCAIGAALAQAQQTLRDYLAKTRVADLVAVFHKEEAA